MLSTKLKHLKSEADIQDVLKTHAHVMICCGRMGQMCIPVFGVMEQLEAQYPHVAFRDMAFDLPEADFIRQLPECAGFKGLPFTVYFRQGTAVAATTSIQTRAQVTEILDRCFGKPTQTP